MTSGSREHLLMLVFSFSQVRELSLTSSTMIAALIIVCACLLPFADAANVFAHFMVKANDLETL
jgi:hypothetical protein